MTGVTRHIEKVHHERTEENNDRIFLVLKGRKRYPFLNV
jgi:hypothetical protein